MSGKSLLSCIGTFFSSGYLCSLFCGRRFSKMEAAKTIYKMGYGFNSNGQLRKIGRCNMITDERFHFDVFSEPEECQDHYEKLCAAITEYVYQMLELNEGMIRLPVPKDAAPEDGTFIFVSKDYDQKDVLMILIQGSGAVRAGQWSRSLIINESLDAGTQIPYVKKAKANGYGIMILNPNDNIKEEEKKIPNSGTPEEHAKYVWDTYVRNAKASKILIVAHSYGGILTVTLADQLKDEFEQRVKAIALTDSVHGYSEFKVTDYLKKVSKNWISSKSPLDIPMKTPDFDILRVSAGHPRHEMTSSKCINSVFKFFEEKLSKN